MEMRRHGNAVRECGSDREERVSRHTATILYPSRTQKQEKGFSGSE
jgi:hypothetical protein